MYQLLLCWRYLRTRYIALASIISVTLGVATMIVVNSVMSGFTTEMQNRIHGILSDVVVEARSLDGFPDPEWHMDQIYQAAGNSIEGMTPTVVAPAMLHFQVGDEWIAQQVTAIGIDPATHSRVSDFGKYLQHPENRDGQLSFLLHQGGYDTHDHQAGADAPERTDMAAAGWEYRKRLAEFEALRRKMLRTDQPYAQEPAPSDAGTEQPDGERSAASDPFALAGTGPGEETHQFDPALEQHTGLVMGIAMAMKRVPVEGNVYEDRFLVLPGNDVKLTYPTAGRPPKAVSTDFTIVDFYESKMSEYDSSFVFVPVRTLQEDRGMYDYVGGAKRYFVNSIQIKLAPGVDGTEVRNKLRAVFSPDLYVVSTWRDKQGPLLAAVWMETAILNVLLFLIIAVAGFGILAIFLMIVVEKTRDIGILKSLGASGWGIQGIFLTYGLSLGLVGSGVGMVLGLLFVHYINQIADGLGWLTGQPVFDPEVYYFYKIPAIVDAWTVGWIVFGAVAIAVLASILPAFRAARLRPVEALRYE
ncbi:MAG: FtsX-like permease family protein [Planctomycetota bacterium]